MAARADPEVDDDQLNDDEADVLEHEARVLSPEQIAAIEADKPIREFREEDEDDDGAHLLIRCRRLSPREA